MVILVMETAGRIDSRSDRFHSPVALIVLSLSATTLVFFNQLFFLKWFPILESRKWVGLLILLFFIPALLSARHVGRAVRPGLLLLLFLSIATASYLATRTDGYNDTYLYGLLLTSLGFFVLGAVSGNAPRTVTWVLSAIGIAMTAAVLWGLISHGSLYEPRGFRNILAIPQITGRVTFRAYYQLVSYGLAFGSIPLLVWLLSKRLFWQAHVALLATMTLIMLAGSRGPFMLIPAVYGFLVFKRAGIAETIKFSAVLAVFLLAVTTIPPLNQSPLFVRWSAVDEYSGQAQIDEFGGDEFGDGFYGEEGAEEGQERDLPRYWGRGTLFRYAQQGWFESPTTFIFGHGFGSFSYNLTGIYPNWILSPARGSVYPHNMILEVGYELGLIGLIPFLLAILWGVRRIVVEPWRDYCEARMTVSALYLFVLGIAMISGGIASNYLLYFVAGAVIVAWPGFPRSKA